MAPYVPPVACAPRIAPASSSPYDPFYGLRGISDICSHFVVHNFGAQEAPPNSPLLDRFVAYVLYRTKLSRHVVYAALYLLGYMKQHFHNRLRCMTSAPTSGHRLFLAALMIASKAICDDNYSNKSFAELAKMSQVASPREINQMERDMLAYLEWKVNVIPKKLERFEKRVEKDYSGPGPYPDQYHYTMSELQDDAPVEFKAKVLTSTIDPRYDLVRGGSPSKFLSPESTISPAQSSYYDSPSPPRRTTSVSRRRPTPHPKAANLPELPELSTSRPTRSAWVRVSEDDQAPTVRTDSARNVPTRSAILPHRGIYAPAVPTVAPEMRQAQRGMTIPPATYTVVPAPATAYYGRAVSSASSSAAASSGARARVPPGARG